MGVPGTLACNWRNKELRIRGQRPTIAPRTIHLPPLLAATHAPEVATIHCAEPAAAHTTQSAATPQAYHFHLPPLRAMLQLLPPDCWNVVLRHLTQRDRCHLRATSKPVGRALDHTAWEAIHVAAQRLAKTRDPAVKEAAFAQLRRALGRHRPSVLTVAGYIGAGRLRRVFAAEAAVVEPLDCGTGSDEATSSEGSAATMTSSNEPSRSDAGDSADAAPNACTEVAAEVAGLPGQVPARQHWTSTLRTLVLTTSLQGLSDLAALRLPGLRSLTAHLEQLSGFHIAIPDLSPCCPGLEILHLRLTDEVVLVNADASALGALAPSLRSLTLSARQHQAGHGSTGHLVHLGQALRLLTHLMELQLLDLGLEWMEEGPTGGGILSAVRTALYCLEIGRAHV